MRPKITLKTFRRLGQAEETMIRAAMPRTSARDAEPLPVFAARDAVVVAETPHGVRLVRPLTFTIGEVARG
ncbi:MAG TPA: hypothetical protein VFN64_09600 [Burkholderiaceae bacterium]|nr:hypothetical protein [Burkholderiaceae bacterium]